MKVHNHGKGTLKGAKAGIPFNSGWWGLRIVGHWGSGKRHALIRGQFLRVGGTEEGDRGESKNCGGRRMTGERLCKKGKENENRDENCPGGE